MSMTENNDKPVSQARTEPLRTEKLGAVPHRTTPPKITMAASMRYACRRDAVVDCRLTRAQ